MQDQLDLRALLEITDQLVLRVQQELPEMQDRRGLRV
jgi:hypothetical protein